MGCEEEPTGQAILAYLGRGAVSFICSSETVHGHGCRRPLGSGPPCDSLEIVASLAIRGRLPGKEYRNLHEEMDSCGDSRRRAQTQGPEEAGSNRGRWETHAAPKRQRPRQRDRQKRRPQKREERRRRKLEEERPPKNSKKNCERG